MEPERRNFRAIIYYDFNRGLAQEECLKQFVEAFSDAALSGATFVRWIAEFRMGREGSQDDSHSGRPLTVVLPEAISAVE